MAIELEDIQGNILRGFKMYNARHFALRFGDPSRAAGFIGGLVSGDEKTSPQITTAVEWPPGHKPPYAMMVGLTAGGLRALGLPESMMQLFPESFLGGPAANADSLGDTGEGDPARWIMGGPNKAVHLLLSLHTNEHREQRQAELTAQLERLFGRHELTQVHRQDAVALPEGKVHFGYRDGIAQPRIEHTGCRPLPPDMQPPSKAGEFLLGKEYLNQFGGNFLGDLPRELGDNATYGAFRILRQDVRAFEEFIELTGARYRLDKELVAAKMMGRWRNGVPLMLSPDTDDPERGLAFSRLNEFDYVPTEDNPAFYDDREGLRCPIGSHARRLNPRSSKVMGKPHSRRIIRRAMPYGPPFDPAAPDDVERGLVGYFICGDLAMQFEFLQQVWANTDMAASGLRGTRDPILGAQPETGGQFVIRTNDSKDPIICDNVPRLVFTRGSAYCLLPGIGGLKFLAKLAAGGRA